MQAQRHTQIIFHADSIYKSEENNHFSAEQLLVFVNQQTLTDAFNHYTIS